MSPDRSSPDTRSSSDRGATRTSTALVLVSSVVLLTLLLAGMAVGIGALLERLVPLGH
jgi:hypothetical protein